MDNMNKYDGEKVIERNTGDILIYYKKNDIRNQIE